MQIWDSLREIGQKISKIKFHLIIYKYCTSIDAEFQDESIGVQCLCVLLRLFIIICKKKQDFSDGLLVGFDTWPKSSANKNNF
jgi:hypothetical protein